MNLADERIVITGANGWLGRELIYRLLQQNLGGAILALGRSNSVLKFPEFESIAVHQWSSTNVASWNPTALVHLAALTKERLGGMSEQTYIDENESLTESALSIAQLNSVRSVVIASSGAAVTQLDHPYGIHKAVEEEIFRLAMSPLGKALVVARIWSVSGRFCTKPAHFLFFDLLRQTIGESNFIEIKAKHHVFRKYVDGGEFLEICLRAACARHSGTIDSTGELVEAGDLATTIQDTLHISKEVHRILDVEERDSYLSDSEEMDKWSKITGVIVSNLSKQIIRSCNAINPPLNPGSSFEKM